MLGQILNRFVHFGVELGPARKPCKCSMNALNFGIGHQPIIFYHKGEHFLSLLWHVWSKSHQVDEMRFGKHF